MSGPVETEIIPPNIDGDDGDELRSTRLSVNLLGPDNIHYDAAMQFFGDEGEDPKVFAEALLNIGLALASLRGPDHAWAVRERFAAFDGMAR